MVDNTENEIDIVLLLKHFYKNRGLIARVLVFAIGLSLVYSGFTFFTNPPIYTYTSQSVIDVSVSDDSEYEKSMFVSFLVSQEIFEESAKTIGLEAGYISWRNSVEVESIKDTSQIVLRISAPKMDKLVELNRRIVSNTIFQSKNVLTGLNIRTLEEAELLLDVKEVRKNVSFVNDLFKFSTLALIIVLGWLTFQVVTNKRIKRSKDIEAYKDVTVIGTIPDFDNLTITEEVNMKNFIKGLTWKKKK